MKKLLFFLLPFVVTVPCSAQILLQGTLRDPVAQTKIRFGITGGANFAKINATYSGINITTAAVTSFRAGFLLDYPLGNHLYFQPRVLLSGKGGKLKTEGLESSIRPYYLEVPLNLVYKLQAGPGKVFGGLGPYAAAGLFGNSKSGDASASFSNNLNFGIHSDDDLTPFDFGGNFLIGYEWPSGWLVSLNYSQGFYNVAPGTMGDEKEKNHYWGVSLGYLMEGARKNSVVQRRTRLGVTAGANFAKITAKHSGIATTTAAVTSFRAGFLLDYPLRNHLYFQPRVLLSGKGGRFKNAEPEHSIRSYYLEVPLNFIYKLQAGPGKAFGGLGPYAAVGLFGNSKRDDISASASNKLNFGTNWDDDLTPFDFGGNFLIGYELPSGWLVSLNYSQGFYNIAPGATGYEKKENHYFGISLGHLFGS